MIGSRYLLDTNVVIALLNGQLRIPRSVARASTACFSIISLGELFLGAFRSVRVAENLARIEELASASTVLDCNRETARFYGAIKARLYKRGKPIPQNDIWIAALASQYGLTLISRDDHFSSVEGIGWEVW